MGSRSREGKGRRMLLGTLSFLTLINLMVLSMGIAANASGDVTGLTSEAGGNVALTISNECSSMDDITELPSAAFQGWLQKNGKSYWYEGGVRQGTVNDPKGVLGDGTVRGREIYDPETNAWYWLDSCYSGAKACDKEVWMPYVYQNEADLDDAAIRNVANLSGTMAQQVYDAIKARTGKWVRYDEEGRMYKGWYIVPEDSETYPDQRGNYYYYDPQTGVMAKGAVEINGKNFYFDEVTGVLISKDKEMVLLKEVNHSTGSCISYEYDRRGFLVKTTNSSNILGWAGYTYDNLGRKRMEEGTFYRYGWVYDNENRLIEEWYNHGRGYYENFFYTYGANGLLKEKRVESQYGKLEIYKYDDRGKEIEYSHKYIDEENGEITDEYSYRFEYEMVGDKEIKKAFDENNQIVWRDINEYTIRNADGKVIEEVSVDTLYLYEYDEAGNLLCETETAIEEMNEYEVTIIGNSVQYVYENGKIVTRKHFDSSGALYRTVDYVYGEV